MAEPDFKVYTVTEPYLHVQCALGEGPYYEQGINSLRFVDIKKRRLHFVDLGAGPSSLRTLDFDVRVTVTADVEGVDPAERFLVGTKYGITLLDRASGKLGDYLIRFADVESKDGGGLRGSRFDAERLRSNDGAVDPNGRFWCGTMTDFGLGDFQPEGSLFVFTGSSGVEFLDGLTIPNSICWSPDRKNMYVTHSTARTIFAFDYDASASTATNQRVFYQHDGPGEPDGCRVDVEGNLWHAVYGEGRMLKISPAGKLVGEVRFPTKNITCPEFVGTKLYVTTAGMDDGDGNEEQRNLAGDLFVVDVGVEGTERFRFRLDEK